MRRILLLTMTAIGLLVASFPAQYVSAAGRPACLVSNQRTGVGLRSLADAVVAAVPGDTLVVKGTCEAQNVRISNDLHLKGVSNPAFGTATITAPPDNPYSDTVLIIMPEWWNGVENVNVTIDGLTIVGGNWAYVGGAVYSGLATLTITNSTLTGARAWQAGGLYGGDSNVVLNHSTVSGNAAYGGAGIGMQGGSLTLNHSTIRGNTAGDWQHDLDDGQGGGLNTWNTRVTLNDSTITGNHANQGGGIYSSGSTLINCVAGGNVVDNTTDDIYIEP